MMTEKLEIEQEWEAAQAALRAAMEIPGGEERVEALKKAGRLRYRADQRRRAFEEAYEDVHITTRLKKAKGMER